MILQDPMASLNPLFSIYAQVAEPAYYHQNIRGRSLRQRVQDLLRAVRIPSPAMRMRDYPHQMSGGMRQRIVGAIALAGGPKLIIADEPTTNLDVTIQAQYLDLLKDLQQRHRRRDHLRHPQPRHRRQDVRPDGGDVCRQDRRAGPRCATLFDAPKHPYTQGAARFDAEARQQGTAVCDPGPAAQSRAPADGLRVSSALRRCHAAVRGARTAGCTIRRRIGRHDAGCATQPAKEAYDRASA